MSLEVKQIPLEKEYAKHKNITREDIKVLREWLQTQPHLPGEHITDLDLILIYRCCQESMNVSKEVLDLHFTIKTLFTRYFSDRAVNELVVETLRTAVVSPLKDHDKAGVRYLYLALIRFDTKYFFIADIARVVMMILDLWQYEEGTWPGMSVVINLNNVTWGHVTRLDLLSLRQIIYFVQECILLNLEHIFFINAPSFIDKIMMILKPLMKKELYNKIKIYETNADLDSSDIPNDNFPSDCGGSDSCRVEVSERVLNRLKANKDFFKQENFKRVNESLRPGKRPAAVEEFGMQGSFKKLDID